MSFAEGTEVPVERSRAEIERLLTRYGASRYMSGWEVGGATIEFVAKERLVRFFLRMPKETEPRFNGPRGATGRRLRYDKECRRRWRALSLVVKAKLEAVETGITTFEEEFLAHIVAPDGRTVGEILAGQIATGVMPRLPASGATS